MNGQATFPLAVMMLVAVLAGFTCAGGRASGAATVDPKHGEPRQAAAKDEGRRPALEFGGDRGTKFSGVCAVDGEKRKFRGETPERLELSPGDERLECEIRKRGQGDLELAFATGEGTRSLQRSLQRIDAPDSEVKMLYKDGDLSTSTVSSGGSGSSSQQTIVSDSSRSVVSRSQQTGP